MAKIPDISQAEWKVMKTLWANSPLAASDVAEKLSSTEAWHPNTVRTLLTRLHKKKALGIEKQKNVFLYFPLVSEEDCIQAETKSFLDRVFSGSVKPLLIHFAEEQKLSPADLDELRKILKKKE